MYYVYFIKSLKDPSKTYIGHTKNVRQRLKKHNSPSGGSLQTQQYSPWKLITYVAFSSKEQAIDFEKYIKIGSGHAFAKKRLW